MIGKRILLIGTGNMGEGILKGITNKKILPLENITVCNRSERKNKYINGTYGVNAITDIHEGVEQADIIIIATKPQDIDVVLQEIRNIIKSSCLIISVAAGIKISQIEEFLGKERKILRVMPNPINESCHGISALSWNSNVGEEDINDAKIIFETIGKTIELKEKLQNAFTAYSVSGCAYIFEFIEAMMEAGVLVGFNSEQSAEIIVQNLIGTAKMIQDTKNHPSFYKAKIASPAGTTIAGLHVLNKSGFKGIVQECVKKTVDRADELGE